MKTQDLFEYWPEAKTAQETKTPWSYEPETAEAGITLFHEDDEGEWYTTTRCQGFSYDPDEDEFTCDEWVWDGGDWSVCDSYPLDRMDAEYEATYAEHRKSYRSYLEWVAEHGEDPCDEFFAQKNPREQQKWEMTFLRRSDKTIRVNWKQLTGTQMEENTYPPDEVAGYMRFLMKTRTLADGSAQQYPSTSMTWAELIGAKANTNRTDDEWEEIRTLHTWTLKVTAELWVTTHNASYEEQLKTAARKALED